MVYLLAIASSLSAAVAGVLQRLGVESAPASASMRLGLVIHGFRRSVWLIGFALLLVTFVLQATALRFGDLNVVQPLLTTELLFLVGILTVFFGRRPGLREWAGSVAMVAGLAGFLLAAAPTKGHGLPTAGDWGLVSSTVVVATVALTVGARRGPRWWRAGSYGAAAAVLFAYNASLTKALTTLITHGWGHVFTHWEPYALAVTGAAGFFLLQNALHAGPIAAAKAAMVVVNPLVSIAIGATIFAEHLHTGPGHVTAEAATLVVLCAGGYVLARSPLVAGQQGSGGPGERLSASANQLPVEPPG